MLTMLTMLTMRARMSRLVLCTVLGGGGGLVAPAAAQNVLSNPGFELALSGWTGTGYIREADPPPHGGLGYFGGGLNVGSATISQGVTLAQLGVIASEVDAGRVRVRYGGWQSGWRTQRDDGRIVLVFHASGGEPLGQTDSGFFFSNHTWVLRGGTVTLPTGTRTVTYRFEARRSEGNNCDGYLDDAFLELDGIGPAACNLADITGIGGPPATPDGLLTGDDFVAFIGAFAAGEPLADVTGIGGPPAGPDGLLTGDDFNTFIAAFATGCP